MNVYNGEVFAAFAGWNSLGSDSRALQTARLFADSPPQQVHLTVQLIVLSVFPRLSCSIAWRSTSTLVNLRLYLFSGRLWE